MYSKPVDEAGLAAMGMTLADLDDGSFAEIWPENLPAVEAFDAMGTQWRISHAGATGLDYSALPAVLRLLGQPRAQWTDTFECLRILEDEAMRKMREASK